MVAPAKTMHTHAKRSINSTPTKDSQSSGKSPIVSKRGEADLTNKHAQLTHNLRAQSAPPKTPVEIAPQGDIVLSIKHGQLTHNLRAQSAVLKSRSVYFSGLLSGRFGESEHMEEVHQGLIEKYGEIAAAPMEELPVIHIEDLGRISEVKSLDALCTDFFGILHGHDLQQNPPPVGNLAKLAIVADRFDALDAVKAYIFQKKMVRAIDGRTPPKLESSLTEEKVRQRLLIAILLEDPVWTDRYSARMITKGWAGKEHVEADALWWDLPSGVEDELAFRRDCILDTVQSLQAHFIDLYTSRERQCKLGYDSSAECDSFQLGQIIRFFLRTGTVEIRSTLLVPSEAELPTFDGDLFVLLESLRQVSEYQVDRNHNHCGIRTRIVPILDMIGLCLTHVGICGKCWSESRFEHAWADGKRPLLWRRQDMRIRVNNDSHREWHAAVRAMFTATDRDWS